MNNLKNIIYTINDCNAENIKQFYVYKKFIFIDYIIICTGISKPHIKFIYKTVYKKFKRYILNKSIESDKLLEWVIIDINNIILHIMNEEIRKIYNLEELFSV